MPPNLTDEHRQAARALCQVWTLIARTRERIEERVTHAELALAASANEADPEDRVDFEAHWTTEMHRARWALDAFDRRIQPFVGSVPSVWKLAESLGSPAAVAALKDGLLDPQAFQLLLELGLGEDGPVEPRLPEAARAAVEELERLLTATRDGTPASERAARSAAMRLWHLRGCPGFVDSGTAEETWQPRWRRALASRQATQALAGGAQSWGGPRKAACVIIGDLLDVDQRTVERWIRAKTAT